MKLTRAKMMAEIGRKRLTIDAHTHVGIDPVLYNNGDFPYALSAEDLVMRMDRTRVDVAVCFPLVYTNYFALKPFGKGRFRRDPHGQSSFPYEFENQRMCREIYDAFPEYSHRLLPFAFFDPGRKQNDAGA